MSSNSRFDSRGTGVFLIIFGAIAMLARVVDDWTALLSGEVLLWALGIGFLGWGLFAKNVGLLIPGGILSGLALGQFLRESYLIGRDEPLRDAGFFIGFAIGWLLIFVLSALMRRTIRWPLIPSAILAVCGLALMLGTEVWNALVSVASYWPLLLIAIGLFLLLRRGRPQS